MEKVFIARYSFCLPNQIRYFQIALPGDAESLIGVEANVRLDGDFNAAHSPTTGQFDINNNPVAGEIKLQSCDNSNIFYAGDVRLDTAGFANGDVADGFPGECYSHQGVKSEDSINVPVRSAVIYGYFRDKLMAMTGESWPYQVVLYVWYKLKETQTI